jgi:hypothetical protein
MPCEAPRREVKSHVCFNIRVTFGCKDTVAPISETSRNCSRTVIFRSGTYRAMLAARSVLPLPTMMIGMFVRSILVYGSKQDREFGASTTRSALAVVEIVW